MAANFGELILDRVRYITAHDLETHEQLFMLTQIEDPSLNCTAEGTDVTDAVGALITTMYRSKQAEFTGSNSLLSLELAAVQYGSTKEEASAESKFEVNTYEFIDIPANATKVSLKHTPVADSVKYIYSVVNGTAGQSFKAGTTATATEFVVDDTTGTITLPSKLTGTIFVEYKYLSDNAARIVNSASEFPQACELLIHVIFRDVCNENKVLAGTIICPKAKIDPSSMDLSLTSDGKHPFTFKLQKDYCDVNDQLFTIVVAGD